MTICRREMLCAFVMDNGPTQLPGFLETAAAMPSFLPVDKQRQLITAAHRCCLEIGLVSGVFDVELMMTAAGPRLIEINARMPGFYSRAWIRTVYSIDILFCAFAIACDVRPSLPRRLRAAGQMVGLMIVPSAHRQAFSDPSTTAQLRQLQDSGEIYVTYIVPDLSLSECESCFEEHYASVAVMDSDPQSALQRLLDVYDRLGLNSALYPAKDFLTDFRPAAKS
jgi:carnosine synthase